jgi:hypothetical protein
MAVTSHLLAVWTMAHRRSLGLERLAMVAQTDLRLVEAVSPLTTVSLLEPGEPSEQFRFFLVAATSILQVNLQLLVGRNAVAWE